MNISSMSLLWRLHQLLCWLFFHLDFSDICIYLSYTYHVKLWFIYTSVSPYWAVISLRATTGLLSLYVVHLVIILYSACPCFMNKCLNNSFYSTHTQGWQTAIYLYVLFTPVSDLVGNVRFSKSWKERKWHFSSSLDFLGYVCEGGRVWAWTCFFLQSVCKCILSLKSEYLIYVAKIQINPYSFIHL